MPWGRVASRGIFSEFTARAEGRRLKLAFDFVIHDATGRELSGRTISWFLEACRFFPATIAKRAKAGQRSLTLVTKGTCRLVLSGVQMQTNGAKIPYLEIRKLNKP